MPIRFFTSKSPEGNFYPQFQQIWPKKEVVLNRHLEGPVVVVVSATLEDKPIYEIFVEGLNEQALELTPQNNLSFKQLEVELRKLIKEGKLPSGVRHVRVVVDQENQ